MDNRIYDAFISYRRENGFFVAQTLRDKLLEKGIRAYLDHEELQSGDFNERLYEAIENSRCFVLVLPPNALDRCVNENDWVRKEIVRAIELKKVIIPVLCAGFSWPEEWDPRIPTQMHVIKNQNGVKASDEYLSAMIDKLIDFIGKSPNNTKENKPISPQQYFIDALHSKESITRIDIAAHSGAIWFQNDSYIEILEMIEREKIPVRLLINTADAAESIAKHMRNKKRKYFSFDKCIEEWKKYVREDYENIELRVSDIPLLRRYYSIHMSDGSLDTVNVRYYTYGNYKMDANYQNIFTPFSDYFTLYREEFTYLWDKAAEV